MGKCCFPGDSSPECTDNKYGTPSFICSPNTRTNMGELWYSYCPRPADSKCGNITRTIDTVKPSNIKESDLVL